MSVVTGLDDTDESGSKVEGENEDPHSPTLVRVPQQNISFL